MWKSIDKSTKASILIFIFCIVLLLIDPRIFSGSSSDYTSIYIILIGLIALGVPAYLVIKFLLFYDWAGNKTKAKNETKVIENKTHSNVIENYETKNSIKYLSNQTLLGKYSYFKDNEIENIERMAVEEELVERGLIDFSPMHEKLNKLKEGFNK